MSTQDIILCDNCVKEIDVSELAQEYGHLGWFHDDENIDVSCPHCDHKNKLRISVHVSYEVEE